MRQLLDGEDDDYEESAASSSPSRLASTSAAERKTSASIVGTAGPTEEYVAADEAPDESTPDASVPFLDPECKSEALSATQELLVHLKAASNKMAVPLPMPFVDTSSRSGDERPADNANLEATITQWRNVSYNSFPFSNRESLWVRSHDAPCS